MKTLHNTSTPAPTLAQDDQIQQTLNELAEIIKNRSTTKTNKKKKRKIAVLDFETDPFKHGRIPESFAAGYYDGTTYTKFWGENCRHDLAKFLMNKNVTVYAHNGGRFDFFYLIEYLNLSDDPEKNSEFKLINGRIASAKLGLCELRDSYLIYPLPLASYKKDKIDYKIMEHDQRDKPHNKKIILGYLESDCKYLYDIVTNFTIRFGKKLTVAGTAFAELRKTGYDTQIKTSKQYDSLFRQFYFGGRTEVIKSGITNGPMIYIDINSAYPYAMLDEHPHGAKYYYYSGDILKQKLPKKNEIYFAKIIAISNGCLPFRSSDNSIQYYRDNVPREYNTSSFEITAGIETNTLKILHIVYVLIHEQTKNFKPYIEKFYKEKNDAKENANDLQEKFSKLMLNSAYGKFGQSGEKYKSYYLYETGDNPLTDAQRQFAKMLDMTAGEYLTNPTTLETNSGLGWEMLGEVPNGYNIWSKPDPVDTFYNVATAASVTAWVRAYLWRAICESTNPIYCDTDSLMCEKSGAKIGKKLGEWKIEAVCNDKIYIGGKKLYTFIETLNPEKLKLNQKTKTKQTKKLKQTQIKNQKKYHCFGKNFRAHKGVKFSHDQIVKIVENSEQIKWFNPAPSFSIRFGVYPHNDQNPNKNAFITRTIKKTSK